MDSEAIISIVGVSGTIIGSIIGGLVSYYSARSMRRIDWDMLSIDKDIEKREKYYAEFLSETNRLFILSMDKKDSNIVNFTKLTELEAILWLYDEEVASVARNMASSVISSHQENFNSEDNSFSKLRDKYIANCKKSLKILRKNV